MGHVQVAAVYHGLCPVQFHQIGPQVILPLHPVIQPLQPVLAVGGIAAHQIELRVFRGDDPALVAVNVIAEAEHHRKRLLPGQNGGAGIALLLGGVKIPVIALQLKYRLLRLQLGLLQAYHVRVLIFHIFQKALGQA